MVPPSLDTFCHKGVKLPSRNPVFFSFLTLELYRAEADIQEVRNLVLDSAVVAKQDKGGCGTALHRGRYAGN